MNRFVLSTFLFLLSFRVFSQEAIPINPDTKMVSVNNIVVVKDTSIVKTKKIAEKFILSNSSTAAYGAANTITRKSRDKMPIFYAQKVLDEDSIIVYDIQMVTNCVIRFI